MIAKLLAGILALAVVGAVAKTYVANEEKRIATEMSTAVKPSSEDAKRHFTAEDLAKLGCRVAPEAGSYSQVDMPLIGVVKTYALRSGTGCKVALSSQLSSIASGDDGRWAGVRAGASVLAKKRGFDLSSEQGGLGEYSEIYYFTQGGVAQGFTYAVQSGGILHSIMILSEDIAVDDKLESIIADKL